MVVTQFTSALGHINVTLVSSRCWFTLELESFMKMRIWLVPLNWHARLLYLRYLCTVIRNWEFHLGNLFGEKYDMFHYKYSTWSVHVKCEMSLTLMPWNGWISTWEYWIWITVKLSYYYFVTRMASTFFLLPFCFKPFIHFWCCHLVCWKYDRDLLKDDQIGLSWELLIYVRAYFRITVCQKASATMLINHNIGLACQLVSYFVIFWNSYRRSKFPVHWLSGRLSYDLRTCAS